MKPNERCVLTINGDTPSIKFALFEAGDIVLILDGVVLRLLAVTTAWRFRNQ
jgi:hypothetical protein